MEHVAAVLSGPGGKLGLFEVRPPTPVAIIHHAIAQ